MIFTGKITKILPLVEGEGAKGPWAKASFEVTEDKDQYPQIGLFDLFKSGQYINNALEFDQKYSVGETVSVEFNLKKSVYQKKDGTGEGQFYSTPCWKLEKVEVLQPYIPPTGAADDQDLPF
tara:strand:- start:70 stop:435 length:366 start_codon:yes stop_codon:yes gene_type:complete